MLIYGVFFYSRNFKPHKLTLNKNSTPRRKNIKVAKKQLKRQIEESCVKNAFLFRIRLRFIGWLSYDFFWIQLH